VNIYCKLSLVFVVLFVVCAIAQPNPPNVAQQFTSNFTLVATKYANQTAVSLFTGQIAIDYVSGGGRVIVSGEEYVPVYLSTAFTATPDPTNGLITGYMWEAPLCWNLGQVPLDFLVLFPLSIPATATFVANQTINGQNCGGWTWESSYNTIVTLFASYKTGAVAEVIFGSVPYLGTITWNFFDTTVGPLNPLVYAPPKLTCTAGPLFAQKNITPLSWILETSKLVMGFVAE